MYIGTVDSVGKAGTLLVRNAVRKSKLIGSRSLLWRHLKNHEKERVFSAAAP